MKSLSEKTTNIMIFLVILIVFILVLKQAEIVMAQNESNITGYVLSNITSNISENFTLRNENFSNLTENITIIEIINITLNDSANESLENITSNETVIPNETSNETSQENFTLNETLEENKTNETSIEPEIPQEPIFNINLDCSEKITRGETIILRASVINFGSSTAKNVVLIWKIPDGFEIVSENDREFCGILEQNDVCMSEISVKTDVSTVLGLNEIKIVVSYEI
ncbi:MAG: hypothetical protein GTN36_02555 [Candidatus Aenigmarchaeota archaeon]|nr:hypothetical protein [Candidatus Aenigmarchaeota archaeon]